MVTAAKPSTKAPFNQLEQLWAWLASEYRQPGLQRRLIKLVEYRKSVRQFDSSAAVRQWLDVSAGRSE